MVFEGTGLHELATWSRENFMVRWTPYATPIELQLHHCSLLTGFKRVPAKPSSRMNISQRIAFHLGLTL
jgi:hypothetical protein